MEELDQYRNIIGLVKYFIDTKRYGVVDRMALAMGPESVEIALYDMLRLVDSLRGRSSVVKIKGGGKTYQVRCCEIGRDLGYGIHGVVEEIIEGAPGVSIGDEVYCAPCPPRPSIDELKSFLEKVKQDPSFARKIAIASFGYKGGE